MAHSQLWRVIQRWMDLQQFPPNQSKLASALDVKRSAVSDWKSGKTKPTPEHLRQLSTLMESSLGPDTYDMLLVALMQDLGYEIDRRSGIGEQFDAFLASDSGAGVYVQAKSSRPLKAVAEHDPVDPLDEAEDTERST